MISAILIYRSPFDFEDSEIKFWTAFTITLWLFSDYKVLQSFKRQLASFCLVLLLYQYVFLEEISLLFSSSDRHKVLLILPISLLVVQLPLRLAFKALLKREPVIDKPSPSFQDFLYTFILLLGSMAFMFFQN